MILIFFYMEGMNMQNEHAHMHIHTLYSLMHSPQQYSALRFLPLLVVRNQVPCSLPCLISPVSIVPSVPRKDPIPWGLPALFLGPFHSQAMIWGLKIMCLLEDWKIKAWNIWQKKRKFQNSILILGPIYIMTIQTRSSNISIWMTWNQQPRPWPSWVKLVQCIL